MLLSDPSRSRTHRLCGRPNTPKNEMLVVASLFIVEFVLLLVAIVLSPILLLQALYLRHTVPRLPEPEGPRQGVCGQGPTLRLLLLGDSAGAGVGAASMELSLLGQLVRKLESSFRVEWTLQARTGATTADTLQWLSEQSPAKFDLVVTSLGVNDITGLVPLSRWLHQKRTLCRILQTKFQAPHIYLSEVPPMRRFPALPQPIRWCLGTRAENFSRALQRQFHGLHGCRVVPLDFDFKPEAMATDGFHPGPPIYALWGKNLAGLVRTDFLKEGDS